MRLCACVSACVCVRVRACVGRGRWCLVATDSIQELHRPGSVTDYQAISRQTCLRKIQHENTFWYKRYVPTVLHQQGESEFVKKKCITKGRGEKSIQNFGLQTSRDETNWKTKTQMGNSTTVHSNGADCEDVD